MSFKRCPGSSAFAQPRIDLVACPACGEDVEVWSDEASGTCASCGRVTMRTKTQSCMDWCKYAEECLGEEKYKQYQDMRSAIRKEALVGAAADRLGWDEAQVAAAHARISIAEGLLSSRPEADPNVVMAAVVLGSTCAGDSGRIGATDEASQGAVQAVLEELSYPRGFVKRVCGLLSAGLPETSEEANAATIRAVLSGSGPTS